MKRIFLSIFIIVAAFVLSVPAQSLAARQTFENGMDLASKGEYRAALGRFQTSLEVTKTEETSDSFRAKIHFNIGVCFYQMKEQAKAVTEFERAVLFNPNYEKAFYSLGMAQFELKNWQSSEKAFLNAIRLNKRSGENWFDLAFVYLAQDDFEAAREAFQTSIRLKSVAAPISHNNLGVIFAISGDFDSAVREFEIALRKSNGKLTVAERNLQFCKSLGQNFSGDLLAKLEFKK